MKNSNDFAYFGPPDFHFLALGIVEVIVLRKLNINHSQFFAHAVPFFYHFQSSKVCIFSLCFKSICKCMLLFSYLFLYQNHYIPVLDSEQ